MSTVSHTRHPSSNKLGHKHYCNKLRPGLNTCDQHLPIDATDSNLWPTDSSRWTKISICRQHIQIGATYSNMWETYNNVCHWFQSLTNIYQSVNTGSNMWAAYNNRCHTFGGHKFRIGLSPRSSTFFFFTAKNVELRGL